MYLISSHSRQHFRKVKDAAMSRNNHMQLDKITLIKWVDKVMQQSLIKKISTLNLGPQVYGLSIPK
jgi:hypothetical protein